MHLHFERVECPYSFSDTPILSLSWMGKVPDSLLHSKDDDGWRLNRTNYYQDGWLATGNLRGLVGVTYTTCRCRRLPISEIPSRANHNLRGHRSEVTLVKWNEPYQKLASCDRSGIIFIWIKYEGRWSVELINDRNTAVTDFSWSHDGRMALICYVDGFVLIGSVAGQRYWSSILNLDKASVTCGIWAPDDSQVLFATSSGSLLVVEVDGSLLSQLSVRPGVAVRAMAWSSEKFKMDDEDSGGNKAPVLALSFDDGVVYLMRSGLDLSPIIIRTRLKLAKIEWSNRGEILAVAGHRLNRSNCGTTIQPTFINKINFYTGSGVLRYSVTLDWTAHPVTALTWAHNDKRIFIATGPVLHTAWISKRVPSLQLLARLAIARCLGDESAAAKLPLPSALSTSVAGLFGRTLRSPLPGSGSGALRAFVVAPPPGKVRFYCTLIRHDDIVGGVGSYVLYLEYLGGLVPILKGKRTGKLRPEFFIYDPQQDLDDSCASKTMKFVETVTPTKRWETGRRRETRDRLERLIREPYETNEPATDEVVSGNVGYVDDMPEKEKLVLVSSNIWGTRFKLLGLVPWLPAVLGNVAYRTSLLHLQPRQMSLRIWELGVPRPSVDGIIDEKIRANETGDIGSEEENGDLGDDEIAIAPMSPIVNVRYPISSQQSLSARRDLCWRNEFSNFVPFMNDELLTLSFAGDNNNVTSAAFACGSSSTTVATTATSALTSGSAKFLSMATQTSFSSLGELQTQDENPFAILMSPESELFDCHTQTNSNLRNDRKINTKVQYNNGAFDDCGNGDSSIACESGIAGIGESSVEEKSDKSRENDTFITFDKMSNIPSTSQSSAQRFRLTHQHPLETPSTPLFQRRLCNNQATNAGLTFDTCLNETNEDEVNLQMKSNVSECNSMPNGSSRTAQCGKSGSSSARFDAATTTDRLESRIRSSRSVTNGFRSSESIGNFNSVITSNTNCDFTNIRQSASGFFGDRNNFPPVNSRRFTLTRPLPVSTPAEVETQPKERVISCMSLDDSDDNDFDINHDCKCNEKTDECDPRASPVHRARKKLINFDSNEVLSSISYSSALLQISGKWVSPIGSGRNSRSTSPQRINSLRESIETRDERRNNGKNRSNEMMNRSLPASPLLGGSNGRRKSINRGMFYSPTMIRKVMKQK